MTEAEWLAGTDPERMLHGLGPAETTRKLRLFMCACCRRVWNFIQEPYCRVAVEVTEKHLEGEATDDEFDSAADNVEWAWSLQRTDGSVYAEEAAMYPTVSDPLQGAISCIRCVLDCSRVSSGNEGPSREDFEAALHASVLRCIFGNPFRPLPVNPGWRTETAVALARRMYESRDFSAMPILADALQDAGCECAEVLTHCRDLKGIHVRGCWVVDLVLGKS